MAEGGGWPLPIETEARDYALALLDPAECAQRTAERTADGGLSLSDVRTLIAQNTAKETESMRGENAVLDAELLLMLDVRLALPVFVAGDNVYGRNELMAAYDFKAFGVLPEAVFAQQEIGEFPPRESGLPPDYAARDLGDPAPFRLAEDLIGGAGRPDYQQRAPLRTAKTKIFMGKARWEDFCLMARFARGFREFLAPQLGDAPADPFRGLRALLAPPPALPAAEEAAPGAA